MIAFNFKGLNEVRYMMQGMLPELELAKAGALQAAGEFMKPIIERTTKGWTHKVEFTVTKKKGTKFAYGTDFVLSTDDKVWNMLDQGTRRHTITAHNPSGRLWFFAGGFVPKTYPGSLWSGPGTPAYYDFRSPQSVNHPGTKARKWSENVVANYGEGASKVAADYVNNEWARIMNKKYPSMQWK